MKKVRVWQNKEKAHQNRSGPKACNSGLVMEALVEMISNAKDIGAKRIWLEIDPSQKILRVIDNGRGFGEAQAKGYFLFDESEKEGRGDTIGQFGTGRTRMLHYADRLEVFTRSFEYFPQGGHTFLTRDIHRAAVIGEPREEVWDEPIVFPSWWDEFLPNGQTGSAVIVHLDDHNWTKCGSEKYYLEKLCESLDLDVADIVVVNRKPLQKLDMLQEPLILEFGEQDMLSGMYPILGNVRVCLFMTKKSNHRGQILRIGGRAPVCPLAEFMDYLGLAANDVPDIFADGSLLGTICMAGLNRFTAENRKSFKDEFFQGPHCQVLRFLTVVLRDKVEEHFALVQEELQRAQNARFLDRFARSTGYDPTCDQPIGPGTTPGTPRTVVPPASGGGRDASSPQRSGIKLNRERLAMVVGTTETVSVILPADIRPKDLEWLMVPSDAVITDPLLSDIPHGLAVTIRQRNAHEPSVELEAMMRGACQLVCRLRKDPNIAAVVYCKGVPVDHMSISPQDITLPQGTVDKVFRAVCAVPEEGDTFRWSCSPSMGILIRQVKGVRVPLCIADDCAPGDYTLCVQRMRGRKEISTARTTITVTRRQEVFPKIQIEGVWYEIHDATMHATGGRIVTLLPFVMWGLGGRKIGRATVNLGDPLLDGLSESARHFRLYDFCVVAHLVEMAKMGDAAEAEIRINGIDEIPIRHKRILEEYASQAREA